MLQLQSFYLELVKIKHLLKMNLNDNRSRILQPIQYNRFRLYPFQIYEYSWQMDLKKMHQFF